MLDEVKVSDLKEVSDQDAESDSDQSCYGVCGKILCSVFKSV